MVFKLLDTEGTVDPEGALSQHLGFDGKIVSIVGKQGTGKSSLLNKLFGTDFPQLDRAQGLLSTTRGIDAAFVNGDNLLVLDVEGNSSIDLTLDYKDGSNYPARLLAFVLSLSDVVVFNIPDMAINHVDAFSPDIWQSAMAYHLAQSDNSNRRTQMIVAIRDFPWDASLADAKSVIDRNLTLICREFIRGVSPLNPQLTGTESTTSNTNQRDLPPLWNVASQAPTYNVGSNYFERETPSALDGKMIPPLAEESPVDFMASPIDTMASPIDTVMSPMESSPIDSLASPSGYAEQADDSMSPRVRSIPATPLQGYMPGAVMTPRSLVPGDGTTEGDTNLSDSPISVGPVLLPSLQTETFRLIEETAVVGIRNIRVPASREENRFTELETLLGMIETAGRKREHWAQGDAELSIRALWNRINVNLRLIYLDTSRWNSDLFRMFTRGTGLNLDLPMSEVGTEGYSRFIASFFSSCLEDLLSAQLLRLSIPKGKYDATVAELVDMIGERCLDTVQKYWFSVLKKWLLFKLYVHSENEPELNRLCCANPRAKAFCVWQDLHARSQQIVWRGTVIPAPDTTELLSLLEDALRSALSESKKEEEKSQRIKSRATGTLIGAVFGPLGMAIGAAVGGEKKVQTFVRSLSRQDLSTGDDDVSICKLIAEWQPKDSTASFN
eukprot:Gregarina_sp_Poly_1__10662@NODE_802_length_6243_cov_119_277850_g585_i0_p2_GENE_NODE_802_length_6243_cov_119_277850_g585_i0NODE_802_length_6243_cov_119_277850_g585_i0_p2_ORF_typecomplete_len669_score108_49RHD3/PF05879_12/2_5e23GBP/PF02263_19/4_2e03GBP/PF02263_19/2_3e10MMR_HSR1/PF01926_23/2e06Dynamin_N/PF00350_23/0_0012RsgA_GTPase/PF03193_16/0_0013DUF1269/PF06897_12/0_0023IIGP/PF05049_13/0_014IIGP/PF05049_13/2_6e03ABC_tran/PF00005_27/0_0092AIG1/PF04548_16/0_015Septin/PF00735_18/0_03AAA_22/PF13401_